MFFFNPYLRKWPNFTNIFLGGGAKYFLCSPLPGEDEPNLTNILSDGLVQPPTSFQIGSNHQLESDSLPTSTGERRMSSINQ